MKTPILSTLLVFTISLLVAYTTAVTSPAHGAAVSATTPTPTTPSFGVSDARVTPIAPGSSLVAAPHGITVVNELEPSPPPGTFFVGKPFDDRVYSNPNIAGITFRTTWADIQPAQDTFVWDKLDTVFDQAEANGKWVELVIIPGFGTPAWVLSGVQSATFSVLYGPGKGDQLPLLLPWDQTYLSDWFAFLRAVSARYGDRPSFTKIAADGPTSLSGEMTLPNAPADLCTWIKLGYTSRQLIAVWQEVFGNYADIFPHQYFSLALYTPLPIVSTTLCNNSKPSGLDHSESIRVRDAIIALGINEFPKRFILQANGLKAATDDPAFEDSLIPSYSGKVEIGWQLSTSAMNEPVYMGGVSDGVTALQKCLQKGVDGHAQFLEVYEPDVLAPAAQSVLAEFASALTPPAA